MKDDYKQFVSAGYVSIWLGNINDEDALEDYLRGAFEKDYGFRINPRMVREMDVHSAPIDTATLLNGFSRWETFVRPAIEVAQEKGFRMACCAFVIYNFRFFASEQINPEAPLVFIGAIPFPGFL